MPFLQRSGLDILVSDNVVDVRKPDLDLGDRSCHRAASCDGPPPHFERSRNPGDPRRKVRGGAKRFPGGVSLPPDLDAFLFVVDGRRVCVSECEPDLVVVFERKNGIGDNEFGILRFVMAAKGTERGGSGGVASMREDGHGKSARPQGVFGEDRRSGIGSAVVGNMQNQPFLISRQIVQVELYGEIRLDFNREIGGDFVMKANARFVLMRSRSVAFLPDKGQCGNRNVSGSSAGGPLEHSSDSVLPDGRPPARGSP